MQRNAISLQVSWLTAPRLLPAQRRATPGAGCSSRAQSRTA